MGKSPTNSAVVESIVQHTADTRSLFLRPVDGQRVVFRPGQFLSLRLPVDGEMLTRPYSIASIPDNSDLLEICFNLVPDGRGSRYLFSLQIGAVVDFTGPWGTFVLSQPLAAESVFLADGTGIAPIRPMLWHALTCGEQIPLRLLYHAEREEDLLYRVELESWRRQYRSFEFAPILQSPPPGWEGLWGTMEEHVQARYVKGDTDRSRYFYICGVGLLVLQLRDLLRGAGYQRRAVLYEKW
ncbi:MAG: ferredoxin--NADP reductase [Candidatus Binatia bacterium]